MSDFNNLIMSQIQIGDIDYDICDLEGRLKLKDLENAISTNQKILGEQGAAYAIYDSNTHTLTFFRANETYTSSDTSATDIMGNTYTGTIYTGIEDYTIAPAPWDDVKANIEKVVIADNQYIIPKSCAGWFSDTSVEEFENISQLDFRRTTDLSYMFAGCTELETLPDLSEWDTSNVTNMAHMFDGCGATNFKSISTWDTSNVTNMSGMFNSSNLHLDTESYVFNWDTSSVTDFSNMFANYEGTSLYKMSGWDTSAAQNMSGMFQNCPNVTLISFGQNWDTSNVTNMDYMFENCPELTKDCSGWNVDKVTSHIDFAEDSPDVIEPEWIVLHTEGTAYAILDSEGTLTFFRSENEYTAGAGQTVTDVEGNNYTGQVFTGVETNTGTYVNSAPWYSQRSSVKLVRIAEGQVIAPKSCAYWFGDCTNMTAFKGAERLNTSAVTNMFYMFHYCSKMTEPPAVDNWDTSAVTDMNNMFSSCSKMIKPPAVDSWDTGAVTDMNGMFYFCTSMIEPPAVGSWDTSAVTDMNSMFYYCKSMTELPNMDSWDTNKVTNMSLMFYGCEVMTSLDVSGWDFSKVTNPSNYLGLQDCSALRELKVPAGAKITGLPEPSAQSEYAIVWGNAERGISGLTAAEMISTINAGNGAGTWKWEEALPINKGGTGATTAEGAVKNIIDGQTIKPSSITAVGDVADGTGTLDALRQSVQPSVIANLIYPVGSIYMSVNSTSPATLFGGTWARITGRFLLAATDTGSNGGNSTATIKAGYTGGEASHKLTSGESGVPAHSHGLNSHTHGMKHDHPLHEFRSDMETTETLGLQLGSGWFVNRPLVDTSSTNLEHVRHTFNSKKENTDAATGNTSNNTASNAANYHNNMPPYLAVYIWKRTA